MKNRLCAKILVMVLLLLLVSSIMTSGMAVVLDWECERCGRVTPHTKKGIKTNEGSHLVIWVCNEWCGERITGGGERHTGGTADCDNPPICTICESPYGNALSHEWSEWRSNGSGKHTRVCGRDSSHTQTESCAGGEATCTARAVCTTCGAQYGEIAPNNHDIVNHDGKAPTCTEAGYADYATCTRAGCGYTTYQDLAAMNHDLEQHEAQAATCTKIGWDAYVTCKREGCKHTTYKEIAALNHDLEDHAAKAPTCTGIGWEAYKTCKRDGCNYTTYSELSIDPNNHDLVHHEAKAPTCTEIGWNEYDTCTRCDYTTYAELPALGHDYQKTVVQPTCEKGGYTRYTCSRCEDSYTENPVKKLLHWYGEWSPNGDGTHSADCRREGCKHTGKVECETFEYRLLFADAEDYAFELCPVCGEVSDGARLALVTEAKAQAEHLPQGELVLRLNELQNGERILSVGFEYSGKLTRPTEPVQITLPAELLEGYALKLLDADGTETELPFTVTEDTAAFTLVFDAQDEIPVRAIHLVPVQ